MVVVIVVLAGEEDNIGACAVVGLEKRRLWSQLVLLDGRGKIHEACAGGGKKLESHRAMRAAFLKTLDAGDDSSEERAAQEEALGHVVESGKRESKEVRVKKS